MLNDKDIRPALKSWLEKKKPTPLKLLDEVRVSDGAAIADVVSIHKHMHCYEIKGQNDNFSRIENQMENYGACFPKITLVVTQKHLESSFNYIPDFWGVIEVKNDDGLKFKYIRKAINNKLIKKDLLLSSLWKSELLEIHGVISNNPLPTSLSRKRIIDIIEPKISTSMLTQLVAEKFMAR